MKRGITLVPYDEVAAVISKQRKHRYAHLNEHAPPTNGKGALPAPVPKLLTSPQNNSVGAFLQQVCGSELIWRRWEVEAGRIFSLFWQRSTTGIFVHSPRMLSHARIGREAASESRGGSRHRDHEGHECVVLSALMNGADALPVTAEDFSSPPNRIIFNRISGLTNRCPLAVQTRCNAMANWKESAVSGASPELPR